MFEVVASDEATTMANHGMFGSGCLAFYHVIPLLNCIITKSPTLCATLVLFTNAAVIA